jgi:hypothetical protein
VREEVRDVWLTRWIRDFLYDLRFSARSFLRSPSFTAATLPEGILEDDGVDRGLMFAFVGAHLGRQLEFVQSEWMNDSAFFGGNSGKDPVSGSADGAGTFDIPRRPLRQGLPRFVVTRGGEYCFMPGLRALEWLGSLRT